MLVLLTIGLGWQLILDQVSQRGLRLFSRDQKKYVVVLGLSLFPKSEGIRCMFKLLVLK